MSFTDLFEFPLTLNRIDLLTCQGRSHITNHTVCWWQSHGWQVVLWDNTGNLPAVGRNKIIRDFQNSTRTQLIMADDDVTLYTHRYLTQQWLNEPFVTDSVYTLNSNHKMGIFKYNSSTWNNQQHHWHDTYQISQFYVIGNKHIPLQDETILALEDMYWAQECNKQGIPTRLLQTVFLREQSQDSGSLLFRNRQHRKEVYNQVKKTFETNGSAIR